MEEIIIYKFQLENIEDALRITSNIHKSSEGKTCHDRQVRQAYQYAKNALAGEKDKEVPYMTTSFFDKNPIKGGLSADKVRELNVFIDKNVFIYCGEDFISISKLKEKLTSLINEGK